MRFLVNEDAESELVAAWTRFLRTESMTAVQVFIDVVQIEKHDRALADVLISSPYAALHALREALTALGRESFSDPPPIINLPTGERVPIRAIGAARVSRLTHVRALVRKIGERRVAAVTAFFVCLRCGSTIQIPQDPGSSLVQPTECYEDQGGCGNAKTKFRLLTSSSFGGPRTSWTDIQECEIEDREDGARRVVTLEGRDCDRLQPGDVVDFVFLPLPEVATEGTRRAPNSFDLIFRVMSAAVQERGIEVRADKPTRDPIPEGVKREVWERDGGTCVRCGATERLQYDHDIPVALGGASTVANLRLLCAPCNSAKGAKIQ